MSSSRRRVVAPVEESDDSSAPDEDATSSEDDSSSEENENKSLVKKKAGQNLKGKASTQDLIFTEDDRKRFVADIVFHILVQEQKRTPLKKTEVFKATNLTGKPRDFQEQVWTNVLKKLKRVFAIELKESDRKGTYFLLNKIREDLNESYQFLTFSEKENANMGLLFVVLSLIFMSNGVVTDEDLFHFLQKMGVYSGKKFPQGKNSYNVDKDIKELFGDVHNLIFNEWGKKQLYLDIKKLDSDDVDNPKFEIRWGQRADLEIRKSDILKMVCKLYKVDPKSFKNEYDKVILDEGENCMAVADPEGGERG